MLSIKAVLKNNRPNLSDSSLKTYNSLLSNLYKKVYGDEDIELEKFNNTGKFINELKDIDPVRRKTYLAALVVLTTNDDYQDVMMDDIQKSKQQIYSQEKNDKQKDSWIDTEDVMKIYEDLKTKASKLYRKRNKSIDDYQDIQNYVILSLLVECLFLRGDLKIMWILRLKMLMTQKIILWIKRALYLIVIRLKNLIDDKILPSLKNLE